MIFDTFLPLQLYKRVTTTLAHTQVNGKPYMKLEMVGRGGSSKVYRVLAADGRLYAVKRVNLRGGVDQATIRGYVNEIALLRRLASCEYIIKLYDHELHQNDGVLHMV